MTFEKKENFQSHTVDQVMTHLVVSAGEDNPISEIYDQLQEGGYSGIPIVDGDNRVVGMVTQLDLLRESRKGTDFSRIPARDIMTRQVVAVERSHSFVSLVRIFLEHGYNRVPVTEYGRLVGIVSRHDALSYLVQHKPELFH